MRIVIDTNVLVSGLLSPFCPAGVIVALLAAGRLSLCYDARILAEYQGVLLRPAFSFGEDEIAALIAQIRAGGELSVCEPLKSRLPHLGDEPVLEVALSAKVKFLVTDNLKRFPPDLCPHVQVVSPRAFLDSGFAAS